jgi:hypothetical protein
MTDRCSCGRILHPGVVVIGLQYADIPSSVTIAWNCARGSTHNTPIPEAPQWLKDKAIEAEERKYRHAGAV